MRWLVAQLDTIHHKSIVTAIMLVALIVGIVFGVRLMGTADLQGVTIILFALCFAMAALLLLVLVQLVHMNDHLKRMSETVKARPKRKGQAAMEFLSTYGWAIMVVLVMIGALSYFGVLNPQKYLPDKCLLETGFSCQDFIVRSTGASQAELRFQLVNNMGESVVMGPTNVTRNSQVTTCTPSSATIAAGNNQSYVCNPITGAPAQGQPIKFTIDMSYRRATGVYGHSANGEISTKVE